MQKLRVGDWILTHNLETMLGNNVEYHYRSSTGEALVVDGGFLASGVNQ